MERGEKEWRQDGWGWMGGRERRDKIVFQTSSMQLSTSVSQWMNEWIIKSYIWFHIDSSSSSSLAAHLALVALDRPQHHPMFDPLHHLVHCLHLHVIHTLSRWWRERGRVKESQRSSHQPEVGVSVSERKERCTSAGSHLEAAPPSPRPWSL